MKLFTITFATLIAASMAVGCADNNANKPATDPSMSRTTSATDDSIQQRPSTSMQSNGSASTTTTPGQMPPSTMPTPTQSPPSTMDMQPSPTPNDQTMTATDQGNSASDTKITADIRKAVVADGALSMRAKNVTIITNGGRVVLKGTVNSAAEKQAIETKARAAAGVSDVSNEIQIKK